MDSYCGDLGPDSTLGAQNLSIAVGVRNDDGDAVDAPTAGSRSSSIRERSAITDLVPGITVLAIGLVATITPLTSLALASAPTKHSGLASVINNGVSRLAALMSIGSMGLITAGTVSGAGFVHVLEVSEELTRQVWRSASGGARDEMP